MIICMQYNGFPIIILFILLLLFIYCILMFADVSSATDIVVDIMCCMDIFCMFQISAIIIIKKNTLKEENSVCLACGRGECVEQEVPSRVSSEQSKDLLRAEGCGGWHYSSPFSAIEIVSQD